MTKNEFLRELENSLKYKISQEDLNEIISDYRDIFDNGIAEGKSEDDISYEIGSPANIARTILDETKEEGTFTTKKNITPDISNLAPISKRFGAYFIDTFVTSLAFVLIIFLINFPFYGIGSVSSVTEEIVVSENGEVEEIVDNYKTRTNLDENNNVTKIELFKNNKKIFKGTDAEYQEFEKENCIAKENIKTREIIKREPFHFSNFFMMINMSLFLMYFGLSNILTALVMYFFKGYTLGKWLFKIKVERLDGKRISFWDAVLRDAIIKSVGNSVTYGILNIASFVWSCASLEHKTIHDLATKTKVVNVTR